MNRKYLTLYFDDAANTSTPPADTSAGTPPVTPPNTSNTSNKNVTPADNGNKSNSSNNTDDVKKYSDADIDKIIEKKFAKWQKQKAAEVDEAAKLATMTAQERAEHERDMLKAELEALKKANTIAEMEKTARGILKEDGVNVPDEIVSCLVGDDADKTSETVKAFSKAFKEAVKEEVKAQLSHKSPVTGATGKPVTKEDISKETNPIKRQKMIAENMSLFKHTK